MPIFAGLVGSFFSALSVFLAKLFAARVAIRLAAIATIGTLGSALIVSFNLAVAPLVAAMFSTPYGQLLGLAFPPIAGTCIATFTTLWLGCMTYRLQVQAVKVTANI